MLYSLRYIFVNLSLDANTKRKNLDMIVLNSLKDEGAGFGVVTNKVTLISKNNKQESFPLMSKREVANRLADAINKLQL